MAIGSSGFSEEVWSLEHTYKGLKSELVYEPLSKRDRLEHTYKGLKSYSSRLSVLLGVRLEHTYKGLKSASSLVMSSSFFRV